MKRHTLCISMDQPAEEPAVIAWLRDNRSLITRISTNTGCGCCVLLYDVEVDEGASPLPQAVQASSGWTTEGKFDGEDSTVDAVLAELQE